MPSRLLVIAALGAVLLILILWVSPAGAQTYDVYSCRLPDGSPAPAHGWRPFTQGLLVTATDRCAEQGGLTASFGLDWPGRNAIGDRAAWRFDAPGGVTIIGFRLVRRATSAVYSADGVYQGTIVYSGSFGSTSPAGTAEVGGERCERTVESGGCLILGNFDDPLTAFERAGISASHVNLEVRCIGSVGCRWNSFYSLGLVTIQSARFVLQDERRPEFDVPLSIESRGEMSTTVSDLGSGIARVDWIVDDVRTPAVLPSNGSCREPYTEPVPCVQSAVLRVAIPSLKLRDGRHILRAVAVDAAGNEGSSRSLEFSTYAGEVEPPKSPPSATQEGIAVAPGTVATRHVRLRSWFAGRSRSTQRTLSFGQDAVVEGALMDTGGAPIANAPLQVHQRAIGGARRARSVDGLRTDSKGRFSYRLGAGSSRVAEFSYRAAASDPTPVAVAQVAVRVRAGVKLRTSRARVRNGTTLKFSGRVLGERATRRALVMIYALGGGSRAQIPVETVRANSDGRFSYTYRFERITGPSVYRFQARVPKQTGFPYLEGASRVVTVRGRT
jgi:hypothetical protein